MDPRNNIATDLFYKIRSRFSGLKLGAETGEITINPEEARFFDFDYMEGENPIGHVSISIAEPSSMKIYFSHGITESMDTAQKDNWYKFLRELRQFAKRRLLAFDTRDIAKDNLDKRDYAFLAQNAKSKQQQNKQSPVGESFMNESAMYGTRTMSYQKLMDTRLIIKHNKAVMDDTKPGARARHISALFVENQDGERFKYPFIHLAGARAMQRHVANGGVPYDDIGKSIIGMSEQIAQLRSFGNYVVRNDLMNSANNGIVERSSSYLNSLREQIQKLSKQGYYEQYRENFQAQQPIEVPQDVEQQFTEQFTVKNFKEDIKSVFPVLYKLMQEENELGYDDVVEFTNSINIENEDIEIDESEDIVDPFQKFEDWAMSLGEGSAITSNDEDEKANAVRELQELVKQHFPAGMDGSNAIESLQGIIEDPALYREIKQASKQDPDTCVRPIIKSWLDVNAPEVSRELDWGDMSSEDDVEDPMAYANAAADADAEHYGKQESVDDEDRMYERDGVNPRDFTTTMEIKNPFFDPNGPEDQEDYIEVGIDYDYDYVGDYYPGNRMEPPSYPDLEIKINRVVDLASGQDITKNVDQAQIMKDLEDEIPSYGEHRSYGEDAESDDSEKSGKLNIQELAEFIKSFYDKESGTFPKGPEGVCTMVGKKFGEQAEQVARQFVERMAPQQASPELQELARIKQLSGL